MISPVSGDILFSTRLRFGPQQELATRVRDVKDPTRIPILGWVQRNLGVHPSEHGEFEVIAIFDSAKRAQCVLLAHHHTFYDSATPEDAERRVFHEAVLRLDVLGQREFSWGRAYCRLDAAANKDWIVVLYSPGPAVPAIDPVQLHALTASLSEPGSILDRLLRAFDGKRPPEK